MTDIKAIEKLLNDTNVKLECTFKGKTDDRPDQLNWNISVIIADRVYSTVYSQGVGHIPGYKFRLRRTLADRDLEVYAVDTGKYYDLKYPHIKKNLPKPTLVDVMHSLILDSSVVINYCDFEEFASDMGYDTDSRRAEQTYNACLKIGIFLQATLGKDTIEQLQGLYQDY
ncbi:MAG: hypothetical protein DRO67_04560 [Candidatus Asgardarchaeum californiense]|nr:MAG: hypothetical protein DRO67_04560 [Candidatus Asgardarchaeum californiense]